MRFGETLLDGARVALTEYPCATLQIGGEWRGTRMRPCELGVSASQALATTAFSDGPHRLSHCATDFAGNVGCAAAQTVLIDNNAPAHPRAQALQGGDGWHRANDFNLAWENPDQGPASPIAGASWRIVGPAGFDSGARFAAGRGLAQLQHLTVPHAGAYTLALWLRDEAGNEAPASAVAVPLRLDDVPPGVAFTADPGTGFPDSIRADVSDEHSGPAGGEIHYRRLGTDRWIELPAKLVPGAAPGQAQLVAPLPDALAPGTYVFRADAVDAAGNTASTTRRADGVEMALRKAPPAAERPASGPRAKTRIFAHLAWRHRHGTALTVPFGTAATLSGRLLDAEGRGSPGVACASSPVPLAERWSPPGGPPSRPGRTGASGSRSPPVPRGGSPSPSTARTASPGPTRPALAAGPRRRPVPRRADHAAHRSGGPVLGTGQGAGRAAAAARQAGRDPVLERPPASGARSWSPTATTPAASTPATGSDISVARRGSGCGRWRSPRSAGPTRPARRGR